MKLVKIAAMFMFVSCVCADAYGFKTNYVDCTLEDYNGHDGTTWEKAFKTIQEGVDAAETGDVVLVAPGWYDEGGATIGSSDQYLTNRVCITKRITLRSRDGRATRDSTFIVGRHASEPDDPKGLGMGLDAIRCIRVDFSDDTHGTVIEGFTIINGATRYNDNNQAICSSGGGVHFGKITTSEAKASYLVDCVVSNCVATRGGGMYFGNAVRCRFTGNAATHSGSAVRASNLYWCIADANFGAVQAYLDGANAVNTTFANSNCRAFRGNSTGTEARVYNSVLLSYDHDATSSYSSFVNCVMPSGCDFRAQNTQNEASIENCKLVDMNSHQFVSTATGDLRPLSGSDLVDAGDARHLELIPERYRYTDFSGNLLVPGAGAMTAGAIVAPVSVNGGVMRFDSAYQHADKPGIVVNGYIHYAGNLYAYTVDDSRPVSYALDCVMPTDPAKAATRSFYAFCASLTNTITGGATSTIYYPPMRDSNRSYVMAPPVGFNVKVVMYFAERTIWTDPNVADGSEMDGTEGKPYNTLQGAVDEALRQVSEDDSNRYFIIKAKPGRYDKGGAEFGGISNRVAITSNAARIRIYAVNGPRETFIVGAEDPNSTHPYKYGPAAVRCVGSNTGVVSINGFTLTGGRVGLNNGSEDKGAAPLYGGGVYSTNPGFAVEDCVFTNCVGSRGGIMYGGVMRRCRAVDCIASNNGALRGKVRASACVFENMKNSHIVGQDERAYNCTFIGSPVNCAKLTGGGASTVGAGVYNSVVYGFNVLEKADDYIFTGVYYDKVNGISDSAAAIEGLQKADIYFADKEAKNYRLCSVNRFKDNGDTVRLDSDFWCYGSAVDIEGHPYYFRADGSVEVGAYARSVPSTLLTASVPDGVAAVSVSPEGNTVLTEGESITFTANDAATRNFQGFYLNGVLVTGESTYTYTYDSEKDGGHLQLEARYVPYWYVDPSKSDSNSGRSWAEAKQSLAEVMKLALPGDTVYAESGVYDIGDMIQHENSYKAEPLLRARVVISNGVSLVSRRGPEQTVIMGAAATNPDQFGCGADALRCVYMYPDTRLEGFTLTGGRDLGRGEQDDNNRGAGVHGWYLESSIVKDCIISNCVASRGGGSTHVTAVNCRYLYNRGYINSAASQHSFHHNCFFDYNVSGDGDVGSYIVGYWRGMRNCTIGANNYLNHNNYVIGPSSDNGVQHPQVYNTLVLRGNVYYGSGAAIAGVFTNCAFTTAAFDAWPTNCIYDEATIFADPSQLQADENGVPIPGKNVAIDAADMRYVDPLYSATDLAGNPRAVNGLRMDIGCYEADWKNRYASDLGSRLSVSEASPDVYETDSRTVALVDDTKVTIDLAGSGTRVARQSIAFNVIGEGVLTLNVDGETHEFTDTGALQMFVSNSKAALRRFEFSFAGTGRAELVNCSSSIGMSVVIR